MSDLDTFFAGKTPKECKKRMNEFFFACKLHQSSYTRIFAGEVSESQNGATQESVRIVIFFHFLADDGGYIGRNDE
jgi:hypothetical protein